MIQKVSTKQLWYHCIELGDLVLSNTAYSAFELDGEVPETWMTRQIANISNICDYECYQWVMLHDQPITYPDFMVVPGKYLGLDTDVGSTMTYNILKGNGEYICRNTVRPLVMTELASPEHKEQRKDFYASVKEALGPCANVSDFDSNELTPELEKYVNNEDGIEGNTYEVPEVPATPEFNDQYLNIDLILPHRGEESRGRVPKRAPENDRNPMGRSNSNLILYLRHCVVKFEYGTEAELAATYIAQSMYAQCDPDGNQYNFLDSIVDFIRSTADVCYYEYKFVKNGRT